MKGTAPIINIIIRNILLKEEGRKEFIVFTNLINVVIDNFGILSSFF